MEDDTLNENTNEVEEDDRDSEGNTIVQQAGQADELESAVRQEEVGTIVYEQLRDSLPTDAESRRRREYRRRMTLDPLVDLMLEGIYSDDEENGAQNETADGTNGGSQEDETEEGIHLNIGGEPPRNGLDLSAANNNGRNYSDLELLGELLGRYNGSGNDSASTGEGDGDENGSNSEGNREPLQPARNHSYLPTAQPLYPEEWIPAGQHRHRLSNSSFDNLEMLCDEFDTNAEDDGSEKVYSHHNTNAGHMGPPASLHPSTGTEYDTSDEEAGLESAHLEGVTLAILEMDDVVLFPGSVIPLRLRERNWMTYLGALIDDARGLYGKHQGSTGGMGEVRIVILPRVAEGTRRTRRQQREVGGQSQTETPARGPTGRWRVDAIRRGARGIRRLTRRRVTDNQDAETSDDPGRNESMDVRSEQDAASMEAREEGEEQQEPHQPLGELPLDEDSEDNLFHPTVPRQAAQTDLLIGRIGTMATITFTHEQTASTSASGSTPNRGRLWQDRGDELVVSLLGTTRVRLIRSMTDEKKSPGIPFYTVEQIDDRGATLPPAWMMQPPGDFRHTISSMSTDLSQANEDETEDDNNSATPKRTSQVARDYSHAIRNLSLRSSVPTVAYTAVWPWRLCHKICSMIQEEDAFQGLRNILHLAAGLSVVVEKEGSCDHQDTKNDESSELTQVQISVEDPSAFADWLASNMPLSHNDRLDLLDMTSTVLQLKFFVQKLEEKSQESVLRCKHCGAVISQMRHVFSVGGSEGTTGAYVNEHGVVHQTVTLRRVENHSVVCIGRAETRDSWFPGYSWTIAYCSICSDHLGWKFRKVKKGDNDDHTRPKAFWGFSSITTDRNVTPRRVSFHTRRALTALLQQG